MCSYLDFSPVNLCSFDSQTSQNLEGGKKSINVFPAPAEQKLQKQNLEGGSDDIGRNVE